MVNGLGDDAERLLHYGVDTARRSRALLALASDLERNARQFDVLRDPALVAIYDQRHRRLMGELSRIASDDSDQDLADPATNMKALAEYLHERLVEARDQQREIGPDIEEFEQLVLLAREVERLSTQRVDSGLADLDNSAQSARGALFRQALFLIPISIALAVLFSTLVMRPVRQLTRAIRALGEGRLRSPVVIQGPAEIASLGHEINWLRTQLEATDEEKDGFLRRMSHELKTPLASLREGASLLSDGSVGALDERQREVVAIMRECTARLDAQIHNLLAYSADRAAQSPDSAQRIRLDTVITQVLRAHRLQIEAKRIHVDAQIEPASVSFDAQRLRMTLDNVIGNAVKFTPRDGRIGIGLRTQRDRVVVDIVDSGPGVDAAERELIFKPFYQGSASTNSMQQGTGVGLSVVRECLEAFGARVAVLDSGTGGACFRLTFKGDGRAD